MILCHKNKSYFKDEAKIFGNGTEILQVRHTKISGIIIDEWKVKLNKNMLNMYVRGV